MTHDSHVPQALAQGGIALLYFILAAFEGNNRVLRVIDSRREVIVVRTAQYFATQNYGTAKHLSQSQLQQHRHSSSQMGSGRATGTPNANNGQLELQPLLTDNRFLLGIVATMTGVLRGAYVLAVLLTSSTSLSSESVINDAITIPLAVLSYSLVLAVLFAHRDLMTKIRKAYDSVYNTNTTQQQPQLLNAARTPGDETSSSSQRLTTANSSLSNLNRRNSGEYQHHHHHGTGGTPRIIISPRPKTSSTINHSSSQPQATTTTTTTTSPSKKASSEFPSQPVSNTTTTNNNNSETPTSIVHHHQESMEINSNSTNNNHNRTSGHSSQGGVSEATANNKPFLESDVYLKFLRPYRALLSMILVGVILLSALVVEAITDNVTISEYCSPGVSLVLGLWALYSFVESYLRLRFFGKASHRVIVAILILTLYLLTRGAIVLPPVQEKLCKNNGENFWSCFFVYSIVDGAGLLLSMLVLP